MMVMGLQGGDCEGRWTQGSGAQWYTKSGDNSHGHHL